MPLGQRLEAEAMLPVTKPIEAWDAQFLDKCDVAHRRPFLAVYDHCAIKAACA